MTKYGIPETEQQKRMSDSDEPTRLRPGTSKYALDRDRWKGPKQAEAYLTSDRLQSAKEMVEGDKWIVWAKLFSRRNS